MRPTYDDLAEGEYDRAHLAAERWSEDHPDDGWGCRCPGCLEDAAWWTTPDDDSVFADDEDATSYIAAMEGHAATLDLATWRRRSERAA